MQNQAQVSAQQIIKCINLAREYPKYYLTLLEQQLNCFISQLQYKLNAQSICQTNQGKSAWLQAKSFLSNQASLPSLTISSGLSCVASSHAVTLESIDQVTHTGLNGQIFIERVLQKCGKGEGALVEIIGTDWRGRDTHAEMIVLGLIIDDGVNNRGHRKAIFNQLYQYVGVGVAYLTDKVVAVINMSEKALKLKTQSSQKQKQKSSVSSNFKLNTPLENIQEDLKQNDSNLQLNKQIKQPRKSSISQQSGKSKQQVWTFTQLDKNTIPVDNAKASEPKNVLSGKKVGSIKKPVNSKQNQQSICSLSSCSSKKSINSVKSNSSSRNITKIPTILGRKVSQKSPTTFPSQVQNNFSQNSKKGSAESLGSSSGFKKIKAKTEMSRNWQQGEYKYEERLTEITYTDGTKEELKEKISLCIGS